MRMFSKTLYAGWADMDFNAHMKNTAYLDKAVDVRMMFFSENGFPMAEFLKRRFGPVVMKDEVEYFKEVGLLESIIGTLSLTGISEDGSRFMLRNEFSRADGKRCAKITTTAGWLDLSARKLIAPPEALLAALNSLARTADFSVLPSSLKKDG
jgi:acyl-CoA thioester hydrolase